MSFISFEQFINESFLFEAKKSKKDKELDDNERSVLLMDGTGSAGKSFTLKEIGAKKPNKGDKLGPNDYEVIAKDDFFPHSDETSYSDEKDPANQARWELDKKAGIPDEVIEWAKKTGNFACDAGGFKKMVQEATDSRKDALKKVEDLKTPDRKKMYEICKDWINSDPEWKEELSKMSDEDYKKSLVDYHKKKISSNEKEINEAPDYIHPDLPSGVDPSKWYMMQKYKNSTSKNVVFDDVDPDIMKMLPKGTVKPIILHSDPQSLASNISKREKEDPRDPTGVFNDYIDKYEFTKEKPKDGEGEPAKPITKAQMESTLKSLTRKSGLSLSAVDDDYIKDWLSRSGMKDDGTYYMKIRKSYLDRFGEDAPTLLNRKEDGSHLKTFKKLAENEEKRVAEGKKEVAPTVAKSKIHPELDMPQRHDWIEKIMKREYDKENDGAWSKAEKKGGNAFEKFKEKLKNDPKFGPEFKDYTEKNEKYDKLVQQLNKKGGLEKFKKSNPKEYEELLDLQANHIGAVTLTKKPGGMLQITTQDMESGWADDQELAAEAFRKKMNDYIDKNGKPKGVIMDLRANTGGSQETAKAITDYFVDGDKYTIEQQKYTSGVRRYRDLPYPEGLEKALAYTEEKKISDYVKGLSEDEKKKYWEQSKKDGDLSIQNDRENKVDPKYRLTGIPTVVQTSVRTFSAGEFTADTIKNLNPDSVHIGHNTGGGANQTFGAFDADEWENADKSSTEKAKIVAKSFRNAYWNEEQGKQIEDEILKKIDSGEINDKMSLEEVCKATQDVGRKITGDGHIVVHENEEKPGSILSGVPQVKSDRVVVDPKTRKPLKDKDGKLQFKGNWEQSGVAQGGTSAFIESDPNTATKDALSFLYKKTGQNNLAKELESEPEKFGIDKNGKDGVFDTDSLSKQSNYVIKGDARQADQLKKSIEASKQNTEQKGGIAGSMFKAEADFGKDAGKEEIKTLEDAGAKKMFAGIEGKLAQKLKDMKVTIAMPGGKKKKIQTETLMDFVPIDLADPEEQAMIKAQSAQYARINNLRIKLKKKELIPFEQWLQRNLELAKDNKDYQAKMKAKTLGKMKKPAVKENFMYSFDHYLAEEINNKVFDAIVEGYNYITD
jgi:hypothetical protein